jgi:hypothetical protein
MGSFRNRRRGVGLLPGIVGSAVTVCAAALLFVGIAGSSSAAYPVQTGPLAVTSGNLAPGETATLAGGGFAPGAPVTVSVYSTPVLLATTTADATGAIRVTVTLPADLAAGQHHVEAVGPAPGGGTNTLTVAFTVTGSSGGALSNTGFPGILALSAAGILLIAGGLLVFAGRRRRRA